MIPSKPVWSVVRVVHRPRGLSAGIRVLALTAAIALTAVAAAAQEPPAADAKKDWGWWGGGGAGYLAGRIDCTNCREDPPYGNNAAYLFQGGIRVNDRMQVGGEVFTVGRTLPDVNLNVRQSYLLAIAQFRPFASQGFFLKGGYGMAFVKEVIPDDPDFIRTWGMGVTYGAGWIIPAGRHLSVVPYGAHYVTTVGDAPTPYGTAENIVGNGWFIGTTIMFR